MQSRGNAVSCMKKFVTNIKGKELSEKKRYLAARNDKGACVGSSIRHTVKLGSKTGNKGGMKGMEGNVEQPWTGVIGWEESGLCFRQSVQIIPKKTSLSMATVAS